MIEEESDNIRGADTLGIKGRGWVLSLLGGPVTGGRDCREGLNPETRRSHDGSKLVFQSSI